MTPGSIAAETQLTPRKPGRLSSAMLGLNKLQKRLGKLHGLWRWRASKLEPRCLNPI